MKLSTAASPSVIPLQKGIQPFPLPADSLSVIPEQSGIQIGFTDIRLFFAADQRRPFSADRAKNEITNHNLQITNNDQSPMTENAYGWQILGYD